jgi:hypothetical protein
MFVVGLTPISPHDVVLHIRYKGSVRMQRNPRAVASTRRKFSSHTRFRETATPGWAKRLHIYAV